MHCREKTQDTLLTNAVQHLVNGPALTAGSQNANDDEHATEKQAKGRPASHAVGWVGYLLLSATFVVLVPASVVVLQDARVLKLDAFAAHARALQLMAGVGVCAMTA